MPANIKSLLKNAGNGFQAKLYEKVVDDNVIGYCVAFAGTKDLVDWTQDFMQTVGLSGQYESAVNLAKEVNDFAGNTPLTFFGHSLGGGEAALASLVTGRLAMTYNAAGVSFQTKLLYGVAFARTSNIN